MIRRAWHLWRAADGQYGERVQDFVFKPLAEAFVRGVFAMDALLCAFPNDTDDEADQ